MSNTTSAEASSASLSARQQAIVAIAALAASGDIGRLHVALDRALDAGLPINEAKEVLVQVYAYAGFPRSLNALGQLMKVVDARRQKGIRDEEGPLPSLPAPTGAALLATGTVNQTRLSGAPVVGPLFDFAPAIDAFLKSHLFGDIFERDNLDWPSRELATVAMLASLAGAESQLQSHMRIAMNVGVAASQLDELALVLAEHVGAESAQRATAARSAR